ncbi:hypothetical protein CTI12_AA547200 [Artemisia annua]|uniref:Uncharacterized protein n=1 Tax=Artemisia annua TaxID=35608 RepID=A0A2U1KZJ1_ARTAN|nr:hypothetical protein CTI12_AA547200 [Artemisia annua]
MCACGQEVGVKLDEIVISKASRGRGTANGGGQNARRPSSIKRNEAVSMLMKRPACISNNGVSVLMICIILVLDL